MDEPSTVAVLTVTILLGVVFTVSGVSKLHDLPAFQRSLQALELVEPHRARPVALLVGVAEITVPLLLIFARPLGLVLAVVQLAALTVVVLRTVRRGVTAPCGCFGRTSRPMTIVHAWRNVALLALGAAAWVLAPPTERVDAAALLSATGLGLLLALVTLTVDDWVELLRPPASSRR